MEDKLLQCNEGKYEYTKTLQTIFKLGIKGKLNKTLKKKEKKKGKRQVPRVRISILTGTAFAV